MVYVCAPALRAHASKIYFVCINGVHRKHRMMLRKKSFPTMRIRRTCINTRKRAHPTNKPTNRQTCTFFISLSLSFLSLEIKNLNDVLAFYVHKHRELFTSHPGPHHSLSIISLNRKYSIFPEPILYTYIETHRKSIPLA